MVARWLCLPGVRACRGLGGGRWPVQVRRLWQADVGDGGHPVRPAADAADGVVHRMLDVRHGQGRDLGAEPAAGAGDWLVCDGVGDAAPAAVGAGAPGPGPAGRASGGGRDLSGRGGAGAAWRPGPDRHRGGGQGAEGDASLAKRWLLGTHQGSVDETHLQSYLDEFCFRFNRRRSRRRGLVFYRVLELAVGHDPVRYRDLAAASKPKAKQPAPPGQRGHPPSIERPRAARPWRTADLG